MAWNVQDEALNRSHGHRSATALILHIMEMIKPFTICERATDADRGYVGSKLTTVTFRVRDFYGAAGCSGFRTLDNSRGDKVRSSMMNRLGR
jgi:hypothetical protein